MKVGALDRLVAIAQSCVASGTARQVLLVRVNRLPVAPSRPNQLHLADLALKPLLRASRAELFHLPGSRWAVVWRGEAEDALLETVSGLEDSIAGSTIPLSELAVIYELPEHADLLLEELGVEGFAPAEPDTHGAFPPLDAALLTLLEASLAQADVTRFARRRSVWQLQRQVLAVAWQDRTLSVRELADGLVPGHDLTAEPWLFRRLTRTLDRRMLALLCSAGELNGAGPFAIDLNVASLVGAEFLRFDANLPLVLRGNVIVGLTPADLVADASTFTFASGFARSRGYRLLLREATPELLATLLPAAPAFDYLQLPWADDLPARAAGLTRLVRPDQLVLTGCTNRKSLAWGRDAGLEHFSGSMADWVGLGEPATAA